MGEIFSRDELKQCNKEVLITLFLKLQEQMIAQIADALMENLHPKGVMVLAEAEHMCMTMRGIKKPGSKTVSVVTRGAFEENEKLQNMFFRMIG